MKKTIMAIMYDFDKTLSTTDMQNYGFIPELGMSPAEFWGATGEFSKKYGVERILSYMYMMVKLCKDKGIPLTRAYLNKMGQNIEYFKGVTDWFKRINTYAKKRGIIIEHYLVSSGTKEIVEACSIAKEFKKIYGCEFYFDPETKEAVWPKFAINYTQKTQYYFRIIKGIERPTDDSINDKTNKKRVDPRNIVYMGDGMTDVPCMLLVKQNGGHSIAIYSKADKINVRSLMNNGRVNFCCRSDYSEGGDVDTAIKLVIEKIVTRNKLEETEKKITQKIKKLEKKVG